MKNCHFSILYNEYEFLTQKLPFLYEHFDQLIFFDLNVINSPYSYSTDGSHEYIKDFPDPEKKITLIEKTNLNDIKNYHGASVIGKQKMFAEGSKYVKDDIDIFWCTDMDEFFDINFFKTINEEMENPEVSLIRTPHIMFWKNTKNIFVQNNGNYHIDFPLFRIARHKPNYIYGHCNLQTMYEKKSQRILKNINLYHFNYVGEQRTRFKLSYLPSRRNYMSIWNLNPGNEITGYPNMHPNPNINYGVIKYDGDLPSYIDKKIIDNIK